VQWVKKVLNISFDMPKTSNSHYFTSSAMDGEITRLIIPNFQKFEISEFLLSGAKLADAYSAYLISSVLGS